MQDSTLNRGGGAKYPHAGLLDFNRHGRSFFTAHTFFCHSCFDFRVLGHACWLYCDDSLNCTFLTKTTCKALDAWMCWWNICNYSGWFDLFWQVKSDLTAHYRMNHWVIITKITNECRWIEVVQKQVQQQESHLPVNKPTCSGGLTSKNNWKHPQGCLSTLS